MHTHVTFSCDHNGDPDAVEQAMRDPQYVADVMAMTNLLAKAQARANGLSDEFEITATIGDVHHES